MTNTGYPRRTFLKLAGASAFMSASPLSAFAAQKSFPNGFLWGVASAAAQVESRKGRGRSNWDVFADQQGHIRDGSKNEYNTEFETRYAEDFGLLSKAGVNAFRFSFAWPRIQPDGPAKPSAEGLAIYDRIIDAMIAGGMTPMATMFHWDAPVWAGDFCDRDMSKRLADYADIITRRFGDRVKLWLALNEPNTVALAGYGLGMHAPGLASASATGAAIHHQNLATGLMIAAARSNLPKEAKVSTTINLQPTRPSTNTPDDVEAAKIADALWNGAWIDPLYGKGYPDLAKKFVDPFIRDGDMATIAAKPDFIGMNYYARLYAKADARSPVRFAPDLAYTSKDLIPTELLPVEPSGLTEMLVRLHRDYDAPEIYVTETGFALKDAQPVNDVVEDPKRIEYLKSYLQAAHDAIKQGVKLRGLVYWSATDNWEWAEGYAKTFGLIQIDHATQKRTPKRSLDYYAKCIRMNGLT
jgi:beta-glucosidase